MRRLRIMQVVVQPVLVWDDGEEITEGPLVNPITGPLSLLAELVDRLPVDVAGMQQQLEPAEASE